MAAITTTGTLTAGNSRTFALAPGSALTLTLLPNCRVTVTETPETVSASDAGGNSPRTHNHQLAGVFTYGPYAMGGSVVVDNASNSGSTVTWGRKDTTVSTSSDGLSLVSGDWNIPLSSLGRNRFVGALDDQPAEITRPCNALGSLVCRFGNGHWTSIVGSATLTQGHTGWDGSGAVSGVKSLTGMPDMLKYVPSVNTGEAIRLQSVGSNLYTPACAGKLMLVVYIESLPGYEAAGTVAGNIDLTISTSGANDTNALFVSFNSNQLREGWNFLKFVQREPAAYTSGGGATEYHPFGVSVTSYGTGADTNLVSGSIQRMRIDTRNLSGATLYFDSIWTGWDSTPQVVLGNDGGVNLVEYALPIFQNYGWVGYGAFPFNVVDSGTSNNTLQTAPSSGSDSIAAAVYAAGWDIINHSATHPSLGTYTSDAAVAYQVDAAKNYWIEKGYIRGSEFYASPQSSSSRLSEAVIKARGYKLQRHARKWNTSVTPWGLDNPQFVGSIDIGTASTGSGVTAITSGAASTITGWQIASKIKRAIDVAVAYEDTLQMFWHGITPTGDTGTGEDATGDNLLITRSAFELVTSYIRALETAGTLRVPKGLTGFYYGS